MKRRAVVLSSALPLFGAALLAPSATARTLNGFDLRGALVPVHAIQQGGPPRDGIPSIDRPRFVDAGGSGLKDGDRGRTGARVIGAPRCCPPTPATRVTAIATLMPATTPCRG